MPLFTVLNPTDGQVAGAGGPYPAFSSKAGVNLNNNQAGALVASGLVILPNGATQGGVARAAFALLGTITPGLSTKAEREAYRLKGGLQEWQTLLRLLRSVD